MNIKLYSSVCVSLLAFGALAVQADERGPRVEYKCHFLLSNGEETVRYITGYTDRVSKFKQSLSTTLYAKDGVTRLQIEKVNECVKASQPFRSFTARQLDKKTLS